jgi:hypothetical protein
MPTSVNTLNQFFEPLVGTPERVNTLQHDLAASLQVPLITDGRRVTDPYSRLTNRLEVLIRSSLRGITTDQLIANGDNPVNTPANIEADAFFGTHLTVAALRTMGNIYLALAQAPQNATTVAHNTTRVIHMIYGTAFNDKQNGRINLAALRFGMNPRNKLSAGPLNLMGRRTKLAVSPSSLKTATDRDGQLAITPRFTMRRGNGNCPAVHARVAGETHSRPALLTLLSAIGAVANEHIYPRQFTIVET